LIVVVIQLFELSSLKCYPWDDDRVPIHRDKGTGENPAPPMFGRREGSFTLVFGALLFEVAFLLGEKVIGLGT